MALRRASRFYRARSATFTLLLLCGLSLGTAACGTLLGAEDEYVVGAPAEGTAGAGGLAGASANGGASAGKAGMAGAGASTSAGNAGQAGAGAGQGGATAGQAGVGGQAGATSGGVGGQSGAGASAGSGAGFGGAFVAGSGGSAGTNAGGTSAGTGGSSAGSGTGGSNGGASQGGAAGATSGGAAGTTSGGAAGVTSGGAAGVTSGGASGSSAGNGGSAGATGGASGQAGAGGTNGGSGGAGGASDPCCLGELAAFTKQLVTQYEKTIVFTSFSYEPPSASACYEYQPPTENTFSTLRFAAKSNVKGCNSVAVQVSGVTAKGSGRNAVGGACVTSNTTTTTVNAAVGFCSAASKIVCNTTIVQGEAITPVACTDATCASCLTAGTATVKSWIKAQDDYFVANAKFNFDMATPADTACYDFTFVYKEGATVKLAAAAKNAACTSIAGRAEGGPGLPGFAPHFSGLCTSPTDPTFSALVTDGFGVVGDCERASQGPSTIACEAGATPVTGTGAVARSACGPE